MPVVAFRGDGLLGGRVRPSEAARSLRRLRKFMISLTGQVSPSKGTCRRPTQASSITGCALGRSYSQMVSLMKQFDPMQPSHPSSLMD